MNIGKFKLALYRFRDSDPNRFEHLWKGSALALGFGLLFLLWFILQTTISNNVVPTIGSTFKTLGNLLGRLDTYKMLALTLGRLTLGLLISAVFGLTLGALAGYYRFLEYVLRPLVTVLRSFPSVALILLLIIYTRNASFYMVTLVLFPLIYEATLRGVQEVNERYRDVLALEGRLRFGGLTRVVVPLAGDYMAVAILQSIGLGLKVQIMGETFMGNVSFVGLGSEIYRAYIAMDTPRVFALALLAIAFVLVFDLLALSVRKRLQRRLLARKG